MAAIKIPKNSVLSWPTLAVAVLLPLFMSGCGESNNLPDPKVITATTNCTDLESADSTVTCVSGYFVDDVVENLNYSCGKVSSVTAYEGKFSCPAGSKVEFSILNPDDKSDSAKKIVLGSLIMKKPPTLYSKDSIIYVTPMDFGSQYAPSIVRLLQTIREPDGVAANLPNRRIVLLDSDKKKLVDLSASVSAQSFALTGPAFESLFTAYLTSIGRTWIPEADVAPLLKKAIHSTVAGAYSVPGYLLTLGYRPGNQYGDGDLGGIRGISPTDYFLGATWSLVDRKGRITGFGMYTTGPTATTTSFPNSCKSMFPAASCSPSPALNVMRQDNGSLNWTPWDTAGSKWTLSYKLLDASDVQTTNTFTFTQGVMDRGAIAGSDYMYSQIYDGENVASTSSLLGRWRLIGSPDFSAAPDTAFTLARTRAVAPTLDPAYWGEILSAGATFPLKIRMNFLKSDKVASLGVLRVLVLEDGNIVSNLQGKCGVGLDRETLTYSNNSKEYPLGTIAQIFSANNDNKQRRYMAPIMLIPDDVAFGNMRNIQLGISGGATASVRLRVDNINPSTYLHTYLDTDLDSAFNATDQETSAPWGNAVGTFRSNVASGVSGYITTQLDTGSCN